MEGLLKGLIAAACVVVIARGAYFGWQEIQPQIAAHREHSRQLEQTARLKQIAECDSVMDRLYTYETFGLPEGKRPKESMTDSLKRCASSGMLSADDLTKAKPYL